MKANSTHISFETAKLLKDCGVKSEYWFIIFNNNSAELFNNKYENGDWIQHDTIPAYTWQEILWEYYEDFGIGNSVTERIILSLKSKAYDEADKYFRDHCILIK